MLEVSGSMGGGRWTESLTTLGPVQGPSTPSGMGVGMSGV